MNQDLYRQHAEGTFHATIVPGTPHCGVSSKSNTFRYEVEVTATPLALSDGDHFLLDNTDFQVWFDSLEPVSVSCEDLTRACAIGLASKFGDRLSEVLSVSVRLFPFNGVWVEYTHLPNETRQNTRSVHRRWET